MAIFIGGIFLGFIFGFMIMALLTMASRPSGTKRHRQAEVILFSPAPLPASLGLRRSAPEDKPEVCGALLPLGLETVGGHAGRPGFELGIGFTRLASP